MTFSNRNLRRRPRIEQRVLGILRGGGVLEARSGLADPFRRLRQAAERQGLAILPLETRYLGDDELTLLGWIAAAQRSKAGELRPADRCLHAIVCRCARMLEEEGLRLYPLTLYEHWLATG
jgi:hypothetical protein